MAKRGRPKKQPQDEGDGAAPTTSKAKTPDLPGVEGPGVSRVKIDVIEVLADTYVDARDKRMKLTKKEVDAKTELVAALHEHAKEIGKHPDTGEIRYVYDGGEKAHRVIVLKPHEETLKVKDVEAFEEVDV